MARNSKRGTASEAAGAGNARGGAGLPQFSPAFIAEVGACQDVDEFRDLLERKGLWLNRNAADGVFSYLRSLSDHALHDDDLALVVGGVENPLWDESLRTTLQFLADQFSDMRR